MKNCVLNRYIIFCLTSVSSLFIFSVVSAFEPHFSVLEGPGKKLHLNSDIEVQREYYGNLIGFPHLYEFTLAEPASLSVALYTPEIDEPSTNLSGIVVKVGKNGGVSEVGRLSSVGNEWPEYTQPYSNEVFLTGATLEADIEPGTYRLEVSSPENKGTYLMVLGNEELETGYFELIGNVWEVKQFLGHSIFSMLFTSLVYAPIGILLMIVVFYYTIRACKKKTHA